MERRQERAGEFEKSPSLCVIEDVAGVSRIADPYLG
tara:strand:+ start:2694 stop:2801 length:108 start_codon:yes stop_codon:yes gene_type:complete